MKKSVLMTTAMAAVLGVAAGAASAQEIRFMCYSDGNECEVYDDVLTRFEAENPGIDVIVDVVPSGSEGVATVEFVDLVLEREQPGPGPLTVPSLIIADVLVGWFPG